MDELNHLDRYISGEIRSRIEEHYLNPINARARLDQVISDPLFYEDPKHYPPFFADHGVVHHRDVALQVLQVPVHPG